MICKLLHNKTSQGRKLDKKTSLTYLPPITGLLEDSTE